MKLNHQFIKLYKFIIFSFLLKLPAQQSIRMNTPLVCAAVRYYIAPYYNCCCFGEKKFSLKGIKDIHINNTLQYYISLFV